MSIRDDYNLYDGDDTWLRMYLVDGPNYDQYEHATYTVEENRPYLTIKRKLINVERYENSVSGEQLTGFGEPHCGQNLRFPVFDC